jgi:hypothetical protein
MSVDALIRTNAKSGKLTRAEYMTLAIGEIGIGHKLAADSFTSGDVADSGLTDAVRRIERATSIIKEALGQGHD